MNHNLPMPPPTLPADLAECWGIPSDARLVLLDLHCLGEGSVMDAIFANPDHYWMARLYRFSQDFSGGIRWDDWIKMGVCMDCLCLSDASYERHLECEKFIYKFQQKLLLSSRIPQHVA